MFKKYTLKNGSRVILSPLTETKAVTVLVLVKVGSRYESKRINGASHFVEHLMFKGTKRRPTALSISKELDGFGAEYNAFTSKDHTGYYIKTSADRIELVLDILSDVLFHSKFEKDEIERERGVIIEEINMYEDNPLMMMDDLYEETLYGDHPLGWNIAGTKEIISRITRKDLYGYYQRYYQPKNFLISVAGRIDAKTLTHIDKYFGKQRGPKPSGVFKKVVFRQEKPQVKLKYKETEQAHLALGYPGYSYFNNNLYALYLLSIALGGNMSSRLFTSIRERKGLCYFIRCTVNVYQDTGNLMIQAGLDKKRIRVAVVEILKELKKVRQEGLKPKELKKSKDFLKGKLILELEASDHVASWLARQELLRGRILTPSQQVAKLEAVTLQDIKRVAKAIIVPKKLNLSLIGPYKTEHDFMKLLRV